MVFWIHTEVTEFSILLIFMYKLYKNSNIANLFATSSVHLVHHINQLHSMKYSSICFRTGQKRCYLILLCMIIFTNQTCKSGEVDITALYVQQSPISWPQAVYGYMLAADCACMGLSVSLLSPLLSKWVLITFTFVDNLIISLQYASTVQFQFLKYTGGYKGGDGTNEGHPPSRSNVFIFMKFSANILPNNRLLPEKSCTSLRNVLWIILPFKRQIEFKQLQI